MKIYSAKRTREDILREKEDYEARKAENTAKREAESFAYRQAELEIIQPVQNKIDRMLSKYNLLEFNSRVQFEYGYGSRKEHLEVKVEVRNPNSPSRFRGALGTFEIELDKDGNITKEYSTPSATLENIDDVAMLKQALDAYTEFYNLDWENLIMQDSPNWDDYYKTSNQEFLKDPDFDTELLAIDLEEYIDTPTALSINDGREACLIKSDTPKFFNVYWIDKWILTQFREGKKVSAGGWGDNETFYNSFKEYVNDKFEHGYTDRVKKVNVYKTLDKPLEVINI